MGELIEFGPRVVKVMYCTRCEGAIEMPPGPPPGVCPHCKQQTHWCSVPGLVSLTGVVTPIDQT